MDSTFEFPDVGANRSLSHPGNERHLINLLYDHKWNDAVEFIESTLVSPPCFNTTFSILSIFLYFLSVIDLAMGRSSTLLEQYLRDAGYSRSWNRSSRQALSMLSPGSAVDGIDNVISGPYEFPRPSLIASDRTYQRGYPILLGMILDNLSMPARDFGSYRSGNPRIIELAPKSWPLPEVISSGNVELASLYIVRNLDAIEAIYSGNPDMLRLVIDYTTQLSWDKRQQIVPALSSPVDGIFEEGWRVLHRRRGTITYFTYIIRSGSIDRINRAIDLQRGYDILPNNAEITFNAALSGNIEVFKALEHIEGFVPVFDSEAVNGAIRSGSIDMLDFIMRSVGPELEIKKLDPRIGEPLPSYQIRSR